MGSCPGEGRMAACREPSEGGRRRQREGLGSSRGRLNPPPVLDGDQNKINQISKNPGLSV